MQSKALDLRRKVGDEEEEEDDKAGNPLVTSTHSTTEDQPSQEGQYGSKVTGQFLWENGHSESNKPYIVQVPVEEEVDQEEVEGSSLQSNMNGDSWDEAVPHDLSMKVVPDVAIETGKTVAKEDGDREDKAGLAPVYTPPSEQVADRFCVYCSEVVDSPGQLQGHLATHSEDRPHPCQTCHILFRTESSLRLHEHTHHSSDIAQHSHGKRPLESPQQGASPGYSGQTDSLTVTSPAIGRDSPARSDTASKRQRMEDYAHHGYPSSSGDLSLKLPPPPALDATDSCDSLDLTRTYVTCSVCTKTFPKQSDLKRHMMCHTGEKPFRCEYCNKPFRAKSSMHYHLKATHGLEIQLSPGLEERYQRMKTRAHLSQRGGPPSGLHYSYRDNLEIEDIEDDTKSTDSSLFHHLALTSDVKEPNSQGLFSNTGNDNREAIDLSTSGTSRHKGRELPEDTSEGEIVIAADAPFKKSKISVQNETVVITRLDGYNIMNGENASIFKCYLCGKMFQTLSSMQCHLSLHFEKQTVSFECCFCNEVFQFKTQVRNHIRRKHKSHFYRNPKRGTKPEREIKEDHQSNSKHSGHHQSKHRFQCSLCRRAFISKISLDKHVKLHFLKRNCFCRICGKSFQQYTSLQHHISRFHWKTGQKSNGSWLQGKLNFFNTSRFQVDSHDGVVTPENGQPLDLIKSKTYPKDQKLPLSNAGVTVVLPQSPPFENGDLSDTGGSHHSSENNWSESLSDTAMMEYDESGVEIKVAPKRSLMPLRRDNSPRSKSSRKSTPSHIPPHNQLTSDNSVPLNFVKHETVPQDSNNNNSSSQLDDRTSPDSKSSVRDAVFASGYMNATNHLLMAKALAAHQSLAQHLSPGSQALMYPGGPLAPSLAAMSQLMSLPGAAAMSVQVPTCGADSRGGAGTSKSPSPASHSSSKSDTSPEDRSDSKDNLPQEGLVGYPRVHWGQQKGLDWSFNMYCPPETGHTDGRKVTSLSRTHSRLGIVHSPINRESLCKPTNLADGRTVYKCPFCSKEFVSFSDINRHMDFHEGKTKDIRPYKCQYCDYYARTNSQLKVHMMRHQGIREFCCKLCNYKGVTQSDLNRHMKSQIHMLKSRNACTFCGEGFVTPKNLEKHLDGNCIVKMQKLNGGLDIRLQESVA